MAGKIDFRVVADAALASLDSLLAEWLPGGRREGNEYKATNPTRADSRIGSFSINLSTGAWGDFATDDAGGDAISLYAYLNGLEQLAAAKYLAERLHLDTGAGQPHSKEGKARTEWIAVIPVPADAPEPPKAHIKRRFPVATWEYRQLGGELFGLIYRFETSDGGKEILPCVFARHPDTGAREWRWLSFPTPRPLYGLQHFRVDGPILVVEGEKCADAARELLGDVFTVLTWPGGSKAVDKANWTLLLNRQVLIWPDCDAQTDKEGALLAAALQPGIKAAERIAAILASQLCTVKIVAIPEPGAKPGGWDVADAIAEGMTREPLLNFLRQNQRNPGPGETAESISTAGGASAEKDEDEIPEWKRLLIKTDSGVKDAWQNVVYILQKHPEWRGVLGADTFAKRIVVRKPSPLGHQVGEEWSQDDDPRLGLWLAAIRPRMVVRSMDTLRSGVVAVAKENKFHPVREFLNALHWDGQARVDTWAIDYLGSPDSAYVRLVSRFFLINMVRRIYEPGCVMRSVPVLEGPQDKGKSTVLRMLARPWFSDTTFRVNDKDAFLQIQGVMLYEISELESFSRAEATAVKAFISSTEDNFRAPYERQNEKHPRETVFAATTNATEYLKDWTGNTRFWPLTCGSAIRFDELGDARDQLLAEAVALYRRGERTYPTAEEQVSLFKPEQDQRMLSHPWQDAIYEALDHDMDWRERNTVSVRDIMVKILKLDLARMNPQGSEAQRVGQILHAGGWSKRRVGTDSRAYVWARPEAPPQETKVNEAIDDSIPF